MKIQKGLMTVVAILFFFTALAVAPAGAAMTCSQLATLALPYATVTSAQSVPAGPYTAPGGTTFPNLPAFCRVTMIVEPQIQIEIWMPAANWNNRYEAMGNGGCSGAIPYNLMGDPLMNGYATSGSDNGHQANGLDCSFGLYPDGTLDWQLIDDFGSRSVHEQAVKPKTVIEAFYGSAPTYSYFWGCSGGGRQAIMAAQKYGGQDFDGIVAGGVTINWDRFIPSELWPQVVMNIDLGYVIPEGKLTMATAAAVTACDGLDGLVDGLIEDPRLCNYDARALVRKNCTKTDITCLTPKEAVAINKMWQGPRGTNGSFLWYGLTPGTSLTHPIFGLAGPVPFPITVSHWVYWIEQNPAFDWKTLTYADFEKGFKESKWTFRDVVGASNPVLSGFKHNGGKILIWHGWADHLIPPMGTVQYYEEVLNRMGGIEETQTFARLFMAPGVYHGCGPPTVGQRSGPGPNLFDAFLPLVDWVEKGIAPDKIIATKYVNDDPSQPVLRTRPLCPYPKVARYKGTGSIDDAANFFCGPPLYKPKHHDEFVNDDKHHHEFDHD